MKRKQTLEDYGLERTKRLTVRYEISDLPIDVSTYIICLTQIYRTRINKDTKRF